MCTCGYPWVGRVSDVWRVGVCAQVGMWCVCVRQHMGLCVLLPESKKYVPVSLCVSLCAGRCVLCVCVCTK